MTRIDTSAIHDALPVADYARDLGIRLHRSGGELRGTCPVCEGSSRRPFCASGDVFKCHACEESGDVIKLCQLVEGLSFRDAARKCARLAGLDLDGGPGNNHDRQARKSRRTRRRQRDTQQTRIQAEQRQAAEVNARRFWQHLARSSEPGHAYLHRRGVVALAPEARFTAHHVCLPLRLRDGTITNVVRRRLDDQEPKILGHKGCSTLGAFGYPEQLEKTQGSVIIVEGMFDWLSARVLAPRRLALGAHGAGRLPDVVRMVAERCVERGLIFVSHRDEAGRRAFARAVKAARDLGVPSDKIQQFDVGQDCNDLNDYLLAGGRPGALEDAPAIPDRDPRPLLPLNDVGNAARFARIHSKRFRHVSEMEQWLRWDGKTWQAVGGHLEPVRAAIEVTENIERDATSARSSDPELAESLRDHAHRSQFEPRIKAMISLARSRPELSIQVEQLDSDPFLLACDNGTLDLRTGTLRAHGREDLITCRSRIAYAPDARCPRWERFIAEVFEPNPDAAIFVQRFAGYSLTGDTSAQCLLFAHGAGANGKGVLFRVIQKVLGASLAATAPPGTFVEGRAGDVPFFALAGFRGKRAVFVPEGNQRDKLAEGLIKQITGGDPLQARFLHGQFFEFQPALKLWMSSNHLPKIQGNDHGMWRRFKLVPFEVCFEDRRDDQLEDKLDEELPGILAWAVRGCLDWLADGGGISGLGDSASIAEATSAYRSESDPIGRFLAERCVTDVVGAQAKTTAVYASYRAWAEQEGMRPVSNVWFGREVRQRGFELHRSNGMRFYPFGLVAERRDEA